MCVCVVCLVGLCVVRRRLAASKRLKKDQKKQKRRKAPKKSGKLKKPEDLSPNDHLALNPLKARLAVLATELRTDRAENVYAGHPQLPDSLALRRRTSTRHQRGHALREVQPSRPRGLHPRVSRCHHPTLPRLCLRQLPTTGRR